MKNKIKVAILSNSNVFFNWQHSILNGIVNSLYADLALHIVAKNGAGTKTPLAWNFFSKLDNFIFSPSPNALGTSEERISFKKKLECTSLEAIDTSELQDHRYDVLINFLDIAPTKNIIPVFKYGVWNLAIYNHKNGKHGPPGAWELFHGQPEIWAQLVYIAEGIAEPKILDQTIACTDWISYSRNANIIYWQAAPLVTRNLQRIYAQGNIWYLISEPPTGPNKNKPLPSFAYPSARQLIWHSIKTAIKKIGQLIESQFYFSQWILLFNNSSGDSKFDLSQYKRILPPKDRFWADPFLIKRNGKYYLFFEELIYKNKLGHLAVMELDEKGNYTTPKTILKKDYHLSYPFLIEDNGNLYMIPETGENRDIQLYKCTDFPYEWRLEKVLMEDVIAVDTTIYKKDDLYWMFTNLKVYKGMSSNVELFLFFSKELVSDTWTPHPLNPVVKDVRKSRPAGGLFIKGDNLLRPSQNCSHYYGYGMSINKVLKLDEANFEEETLHSIEPQWKKNLLCTHTFNSWGHIQVSDAQIRRRKFF